MTSYEKYDKVNIWWFPADFCQARYGKYHKSGNNSCTLISLIFANKLSKSSDFSQNVEELPTRIWNFIGSSINDGNKVYRDRVPKSLNISIPAAILELATRKTIDFQLVEWFFTQLDVEIEDPFGISEELARILKTTLKVFQHQDWEVPSHLFAAIIADSRTIIISFDLNNSIASFFDSHRHGENTGAVFAQATMEDIDNLMFWYITMMDTSFSSRPEMYEIAFLSSHRDLSEIPSPPFGDLAKDLKKSQPDAPLKLKPENFDEFDEEKLKT
ncbi:uncharacterized protein LOC133848908 [Drosophila sulfurigaster albostrigata]|uniref:uncharacterized protein LOC133848908 n=1 Tax=Drosophila sulfurigaster albostrigata TaxID=89887 RepID=UPI002D218417|nr:uncharacterized protein LOC133848908 [Drosophila sulfurigaster albostrigata]XP_062140633.1 uncharacterized protein LOC133848908 [Drosophila sulfurigaster albostrigata]